ncbi:MAG: ATP-dependent zinc metalloprotease FtsH [Phycisphaerales bacterium JB063]
MPELDNKPRRDDEGKPEEPGKPNGGKSPSPFGRWPLGWVLLIGLAVVMLLVMSTGQSKPVDISQDEFKRYAMDGEFKNGVIVEKPTMFVAELVDGHRVTDKVTEDVTRVSFSAFAESKAFYNHQFIALNQAAAEGNPPSENFVTLQLEADPKDNNLFLLFLVQWGPLFLIAFLIYFFIFRAMRGGGGGPGGMLGNFGRSKHKMLTKEHSSVTLSDVAGIDEAKDEVAEIIEFLKQPKKFQRLGGRVPRGVLLIGPPGCGKTLLAKAVAGEADVPFFSISGSDFVEMFVGVGASRVRDLFKQAKDSSPCIIFLDEIDAVGRRRGSGFSSGGHDEREQTLNAILVEMDGFDSSDQVIVLASTNRADVLDPALTRPGRFDRSVQVHLPDVKGRMEILKVHSRKIKMSPDVDLERLARGTPMFSGAELEAIINEAAIAATLLNKDWVEQEDLEEARDKVRYGRSRKSARVEEEEKKVIAYHEAGHAVITYFDEHAEPLHKVTIIPRGGSLGATFMLPDKDRHILGKKRLLAMMRVSYGGRIAEQMFCDDQYNGTAGDIRQATGIARAMVTEYGMSDRVGFQLFNDDSQDPYQRGEQFSDDTAKAIDEEVKRIIDETYAAAVKLIEDHRQQVIDLAEALLKYETLTFDEVDKLMKGEPLGKPTVGDLLQQEREKVAEPKPVAPPIEDAGDDTPGMLPSPA